MIEERAVIGSGRSALPRERHNCGRLDMRICRDGRWFYHGTPIPRKEMVCLFASTLTRRADGSYWLITPAEEAEIEVEDAPFLAVEMFVCGTGREQCISFRTNVDEMITLDAEHPWRLVADGDGAPPYVTVREGLEARVARTVYYDLVAIGVEERIDGEALYGVWSRGHFFPLGRAESSI